MTDASKTLRRIWRSAQMYIGFHKGSNGRPRRSTHAWSAKNGWAILYHTPDDREAFVVLEDADKKRGRDVQLKLHPDKLVLRRDPGQGWDGLVVEDARLMVHVNGKWITIEADGAILFSDGDDVTEIASDGSVTRRTPDVTASISPDGCEVISRTPVGIGIVTAEGAAYKRT